jgi:hypothetical protein
MSFESKGRIYVTGEPFDIVKGINISVGVFRKTEKQSLIRATNMVVYVQSSNLCKVDLL